MTTFRLARKDEHDYAAQIIYNAFRLNWDINWWQTNKKELRSLDNSASAQQQTLTSIESARLVFYRSVIALTRLIGGLVILAIPDESSTPAAVLCWLPQGAKPTLWPIIRSGLFFTVFRFGIRGLLNFLSFENSLDKLYARCLPSLGYKSRHEGAFVQIVATDPAHAGKGYSARLLEWQIERHRKENPSVPVFLDTANDYSVRIYEKLGFRELGRHRISIDTNATLDQYRDEEFMQAAMMLEPAVVS